MQKQKAVLSIASHEKISSLELHANQVETLLNSMQVKNATMKQILVFNVSVCLAPFGGRLNISIWDTGSDNSLRIVP